MERLNRYTTQKVFGGHKMNSCLVMFAVWRNCPHGHSLMTPPKWCICLVFGPVSQPSLLLITAEFPLFCRTCDTRWRQSRRNERVLSVTLQNVAAFETGAVNICNPAIQATWSVCSSKCLKPDVYWPVNMYVWPYVRVTWARADWLLWFNRATWGEVLLYLQMEAWP